MSKGPSFNLTPQARRQINQASKWWQENRPDAPDAIGEEIGRALRLISMQPRVGASAQNVNLRGVRRIHLARIHYHLYYRLTASGVEVLAFWHSSRHSGPRV